VLHNFILESKSVLESEITLLEHMMQNQGVGDKTIRRNKRWIPIAIGIAATIGLMISTAEPAH
jgi:hypothetical protein